jgi:NADH:ubiquinone oxidoreductase subunit E
LITDLPAIRYSNGKGVSGMVYIEVCVGSSCHLKGAPDIVELMQQYIADAKLEDDIILTGAFCAGRCNRVGVTITVNDAPYTGITKESFRDFWQDAVLPAVRKDREG